MKFGMHLDIPFVCLKKKLRIFFTCRKFYFVFMKIIIYFINLNIAAKIVQILYTKFTSVFEKL